jgi:putative transcriptional regulator
MIEVLKNKNVTTRFQILVEIANSGPNVQQREIAKRLHITPQAVSDYIAQLTREGKLISQGRSSYRITNEGVNWMIGILRELSGYIAYIQGAVANISVCAALAEDDLEKGQRVSLKMKNGLLFASSTVSSGARGITVTKSDKGDDVGVTDIDGIVPLKIGRATILRVPAVQRGGSRKADFNILKQHLKRRPFTAAIGLEAFVCLRKVGADFQMYGAIDAAIEAARSGLNPLVVCVESETSQLISRLEEAGVGYDLFSAELV